MLIDARTEQFQIDNFQVTAESICCIALAGHGYTGAFAGLCRKMRLNDGG